MVQVLLLYGTHKEIWCWIVLLTATKNGANSSFDHHPPNSFITF